MTTLRQTTADRIILDEFSARRRDLYLTALNRQTSTTPAGFEPAIPTNEWPQTHVLDRAATWIGTFLLAVDKLKFLQLHLTFGSASSQYLEVKVHKINIVTCFCKCATLSLILSYRTYIRALWRIFGPKRETVTADGRGLHNEVIHNLYPSNSMRVIISRGSLYNTHGRGKKCVQNCKRKTLIKIPFGEISIEDGSSEREC
jgi:hypothetical protein